MQALNLLQKMLVKKPEERASVEVALKHAYLTGGLDTQEVQGTFAMLHESQQSFRNTLEEMKAGGPTDNRNGVDVPPQRLPGGRGRGSVRT